MLAGNEGTVRGEEIDLGVRLDSCGSFVVGDSCLFEFGGGDRGEGMRDGRQERDGAMSMLLPCLSLALVVVLLNPIPRPPPSSLLSLPTPPPPPSPSSSLPSLPPQQNSSDSSPSPPFPRSPTFPPPPPPHPLSPPLARLEGRTASAEPPVDRSRASSSGIERERTRRRLRRGRIRGREEGGGGGVA